MWWMKDAERVRREVAQIEAMRDNVTWLHALAPRILLSLEFIVDFELELGGERKPFRLTYPAFYPATPPSVAPRDGVRLSSHQYSTGELCLEYRPDNWDPRVTGAMMINSAYRLISTEAGLAGLQTEVPSAHRESQGQQLRGRFTRFLWTPSAVDAVRQQPLHTIVPAKVSEIYAEKACTAVLKHVGEAIATTPLSDTPMPSGFPFDYPAFVFRTNVGLSLSSNPTREDLLAIADTAALSTQSHLLILAEPDRLHAYLLSMSDSATTIYHYRAVDVPGEKAERLPPAFADLAAKTVGIVGAGSVGSKIATSLARSGVKKFVIIDDDLFLPGNLVRNDLDAGALGSHKVDALEARLKAVAVGVEVNAQRIVFGGQEASGRTASAFGDLVSCDLLIDATADPRTFNLIGTAAEAGKRPFIWAEVYAGGVGGFVGRLRPAFEPPPHAARRQYLGWWESQGIVYERAATRYDDVDGAGAPLIASDADVTVIAAHATRMALDVLLDPASGAFPHSGYVIGLQRSKLFHEPFDTRPIDFVPEGEWGKASAPEMSQKAGEMILDLIKKATDAGQA